MGKTHKVIRTAPPSREQPEKVTAANKEAKKIKRLTQTQKNTSSKHNKKSSTVLSAHHFANVIDVIRKYDQVTAPKSLKLDPLDTFAKATVTVNFHLSRSVPEDDQTPTPIDLPCSRFDINKVKICLLVPEPQRFWKDKIEDELDNDSTTNEAEIEVMKRIAKVIDYSHLRKNFPNRTERTALRRDYDLFVCHPKLVNHVTSLLGAPFYQSNTFLYVLDIPQGVPDTEVKLAPLLDSLLRRTYFRMKPGDRLGIKIGQRCLPTIELAANALACVQFVKGHMQKLNESLIQQKESTEESDPNAPNPLLVPWDIITIDILVSTSISLTVFENVSLLQRWRQEFLEAAQPEELTTGAE